MKKIFEKDKYFECSCGNEFTTNDYWEDEDEIGMTYNETTCDKCGEYLITDYY